MPNAMATVSVDGPLNVDVVAIMPRVEVDGAGL